jgi:hypothetical protein
MEGVKRKAVRGVSEGEEGPCHPGAHLGDMGAHRAVAAGALEAERHAQVERRPFGCRSVAISTFEARGKQPVEGSEPARRVGSCSHRCRAEGGGDGRVDGIGPFVHRGEGEGLQLQLLRWRSDLEVEARRRAHLHTPTKAHHAPLTQLTTSRVRST